MACRWEVEKVAYRKSARGEDGQAEIRTQVGENLAPAAPVGSQVTMPWGGADNYKASPFQEGVTFRANLKNPWVNTDGKRPGTPTPSPFSLEDTSKMMPEFVRSLQQVLQQRAATMNPEEASRSRWAGALTEYSAQMAQLLARRVLTNQMEQSLVGDSELQQWLRFTRG